MLRKTGTILIAILIANCGGSKDSDFVGVGTEIQTQKEDIEITENGKEVTVRSNAGIGNVKISGSNNIVKFESIPESIKIYGNDNTVYEPKGVTAKDYGAGNTIIKPIGASPIQ